jgi:type III pantothenate kinase
MLLAVNINNTSTTVGVFAGEELRSTWRISTERRRSADELGMLLTGVLRQGGVEIDEISDITAASVVPDLDPIFLEACKRYLHGIEPLMVGTGVRTGLRILYDDPRDVGADRVVDAVAAVHLYGSPVIIVDMGTAIVFDAINAQGDYLGGAISPGVAIAAEALFERAAKLYRVELKQPQTAIGRNTPSAIQSGFFYGYIGLIEGVVGRFRQELGGDGKVIATGGWANWIGKECPSIDIVNPELALVGLRLIHEMNRSEGRVKR